MKKYDVIIVGAGPAGLRCAEVLCECGKKVLVLEKNKIACSKVCAAGLSLKGLDLKLDPSIIEKKFDKFIIHTKFQKTDMKLNLPFLGTINREKLGDF
jgi:flavin-dependent dehydrogenase